jgi:hypothetical protein
MEPAEAGVSEPSPGEPGEPDEPLQFDHAEPVAASPVAPCVVCKRALETEYFQINGKIVCSSCRVSLQASLAKPVPGATVRATVFGSGAAIAGSLIFYAVAKAMDGMQYGIVGIVVGVLVGVAVRRGSGNRGGGRFQAIAIALTYLSIASSNVPTILDGVRQGAHKDRAIAPPATSALAAATPPPADPGRSPASMESPSAPAPPPPSLGGLALVLLLLFGFALASPLLGGIIGVVIVGIALYEAWKINRPLVVVVRGPFRIGG